MQLFAVSAILDYYNTCLIMIKVINTSYTPHSKQFINLKTSILKMPEKTNFTQARQLVALFILLFTALSCNSDNEVSVFEKELNYIPVEVKNSFSFDEIFDPGLSDSLMKNYM